MTTTKMKITISHDQDSIDPSATYSEAEFQEVKASLESEYTKAILAEYPDAEIDFNGSDTTYAVRVSGLEDDYLSNTVDEDWINHTLETVFESGLFWL